MPQKSKPNLDRIRILVLDVDGVLTDGTITVNGDGTESKSFNALDGHGIRMWKRAELKIAFLSGRVSPPTKHRADQLQIDHCLEDCHEKLPALQQLLRQLGLSADQVAYVGDDLTDLPPMRNVGFAVAVANAVKEVKENADFVTTRCGGSAAVREVIEYILKNTGRWPELAKRYVPDSKTQ